ncbi:MAG: DUF3870 domain-containing protein [Lachnospiraceae bacterium]|nr:DUF3870 domain-containing protein [Lachnospiraceae bacterium]
MRPVYYPEDSVFVTGTAKVTKEDAINTVYGVFSLSMVIDIHSNRIISVSANMIMEETNDFLSYLMTGKNIVTDIDDICASLRRRFLALSQKAVMVALRDAQNRYLMTYPHTRETETQN